MGIGAAAAGTMVFHVASTGTMLSDLAFRPSLYGIKFADARRLKQKKSRKDKGGERREREEGERRNRTPAGAGLQRRRRFSAVEVGWQLRCRAVGQSEREGAGQRRDGGRAVAALAPARKKHGVSSGARAGSIEEEEVEGKQSRTPARVLGRSRLHQAEASAALCLGRRYRAGPRRRCGAEQRWGEGEENGGGVGEEELKLGARMASSVGPLL
ncbi:unnamed protein product [Miscanthus lutarioriparius]|uniref:Uncharacterized protein n=1 Tax=Miscanthus lutarioriparius TaxID=422564 RepID=A0A811Q8Y8_9POAL|nr:unnamed protein product [Miscanthus lutarioriparius]